MAVVSALNGILSVYVLAVSRVFTRPVIFICAERDHRLLLMVS